MRSVHKTCLSLVQGTHWSTGTIRKYVLFCIANDIISFTDGRVSLTSKYYEIQEHAKETTKNQLFKQGQQLPQYIHITNRTTIKKEYRLKANEFTLLRLLEHITRKVHKHYRQQQVYYSVKKISKLIGWSEYKVTQSLKKLKYWMPDIWGPPTKEEKKNRRHKGARTYEIRLYSRKELKEAIIKKLNTTTGIISKWKKKSISQWKQLRSKWTNDTLKGLATRRAELCKYQI